MKLFRRYGKIRLNSERERHPVPIVADAAIAAGVIGEGRLVPLLIIDTTDRPDLQELIRIHEHLPPGDVDVQWCILPGSTDSVALVLCFKRPIETIAILQFNIVSQGILVEQILTAKLLYLQSGRPGDRLKSTLGVPRIFVEVPDTKFRKEWEPMFHKKLAEKMRIEGLGRQQAKAAAGEAIEEMRKLVSFRMPR